MYIYYHYLQFDRRAVDTLSELSLVLSGPELDTGPELVKDQA